MIVPTGYSVVDYGCMVQCEPRTSVYAEALRRSITPGCKVIDLGAAFGIFSLLACKYGAGEVVAIEPDPAARRADGFGERRKFPFIELFDIGWAADVKWGGRQGTGGFFRHGSGVGGTRAGP